MTATVISWFSFDTVCFWPLPAYTEPCLDPYTLPIANPEGARRGALPAPSLLVWWLLGSALHPDL